MIKNYKRLNYNIIKQSLVYKTYKMSTYYPPYKSSSNNIKVELDLTNYATKTDLKVLHMLMLVVLLVKLI